LADVPGQRKSREPAGNLCVGKNHIDSASGARQRCHTPSCTVPVLCKHNCYSAAREDLSRIARKRERPVMRFRACAALLAALSTAVLAADKPQYGTWGFDASGMDSKTKPGNDFFR